MKVAVLQSNYIPWKGYFDLINEVDLFIFYDEVKYTKNDWRNRNQIYTRNGLQWLSIPIAASAVKGKISEVQIEPLKWQALHHKSLALGYSKAPYFRQLDELITDYLLEKQWHSLKELNHYLIRRIAGSIGIKTTIEDSTRYSLEGDRVSRLLGLLSQAGATTYVSGPSARDYLTGTEGEFARRGIQLVYKQYPEYPPYRQLCEPFQQHVSIVDLIAHVDYREMARYISKG
jgi:hypothetical protein